MTMRGTVRRDPSKVLQFGFLALLFVCLIQVAWWITDNLYYTNEVRREVATLSATNPALAEALDDLAAASSGRVNRYVWEGGFFLLVLLAGMTILTRTIRHDRELRQRQQNFLAAVSHEFKSPLASMQLAAETLVLRSSEDDTRRLGERILGDCERLLRMVENLLDTARLEEGRHLLARESLALRDIVEREVAAIADRASRHSIEARAEIDGDLRIDADAGAVETVLRNLLDNAFKACVAGGGRSIVASAGRDGGKVRLTVTDDGQGFAPEDAAMLFEKFYRVGDEQTRTTPGTGLGLYIVKRLVDMSGATLSARSDGPGSGATFAVDWPEVAGQ